jgi:anti-sigma-K factor RskA
VTGHEEIESLLGAYALDAVDPEEAEVVRRHLPTCPRCRAEVDATVEVAARLGTRAALEDGEPPPPELWGRIAGRLGETAGRDPGTVRVPAAGTADAPAGGRRGAPRHLLRWAAAAVAVAAVAAIAVLGVALASTDGQLGQAREALDGRGSQAAVAAALADPRHRLVELRSPTGAQLASFVLVPGGQGYMVSTSMPALPADETYQLWAVVAGQPISMGLLGSEPDRAAFTVAPSAHPTELAVTVEPAGGVTTPDRRPVASGTIAAT